MNDTLKKAEELIQSLLRISNTNGFDMAKFGKLIINEPHSLKEIKSELLSLISNLVEENERLKSILELHAQVLVRKRQTALSQEMGDYDS